MKLLFVFPLPSGGMETLNRQRCLALKRYGFDCHLLYFRKGSGLRNIRAAGIPVQVTDSDEEIAGLLHQERYDAVVATYYHDIPVRLRRLGYTGRIIYEVQGLGNLEGARHALSAASADVAAAADAVLLPRTPHLNELVREYMAGMPIYSFHNCIDTDDFRYVNASPPPYPVIGWVGRIEYIKNWRYFLEICRVLAWRVPSLRIWIFEDRSLAVDNAEFEKLSAEYGLDGIIVRRSGVPHRKMAAYYSMIGDSGGALLSTSIMEGFGYAPLEAMLCLCPVVTTDSDGVTSYLRHNITGKLIPHGDPYKAADEVAALMRPSKLRSRIRIQARSHIVRHFSVAAYGKRFERMLRELGAGEEDGGGRRRWSGWWRGLFRSR